MIILVVFTNNVGRGVGVAPIVALDTVIPHVRGGWLMEGCRKIYLGATIVVIDEVIAVNQIIAWFSHKSYGEIIILCNHVSDDGVVAAISDEEPTSAIVCY